MPRALTFAWHTFPPEGRDAVAALWRQRRDQLAADGCRYWVFRSTTDEGAFLEFTEGSDEQTLVAARQRAGLPTAGVYTELELS